MPESEVNKYHVINNRQLMHFEINVHDDIAFLEYRYHYNNIVFMHTEVPENMEGEGVGSALARHAFNFARENNKPVKVYCSFVLSWLKRHPEFNEQVQKDD